VDEPESLAAAAIDRQAIRLAIEAAANIGSHWPRRWMARWGALRACSSVELNQEYYNHRSAITARLPKKLPDGLQW
jgi:hypothetical protein